MHAIRFSAAILLCLTACAEPDAPTSDAAQVDLAPPTDARSQALQAPEWIKVSALPENWGGIYALDCALTPPRDAHFFDYHDPVNPAVYYFSYIVYPETAQRPPQAKVVKIDYAVWQNQNWPSHYLLYSSTKNFQQIELQGDSYTGLHQTLDGQAWQPLEDLDTAYALSDMARWGVDLENTQAYGTTPACDIGLAEPWLDIAFSLQNGGVLRLRDLINP